METRLSRKPTNTQPSLPLRAVKTAQPDDTKVKILTLTKPRDEKSRESCDDAKPGFLIAGDSVPDRPQLPKGLEPNDRPAFCT